MDEIRDLIGKEHGLEQAAWALKRFARDLGVPVVGAYHVTCSDEVEWECTSAFQQLFAQELLPSLKPGNQAAFRSINLGARYEWGAIRVAEEHFATADSQTAFKLMVVKINAHVGVRETPEGPEYGSYDRYGRQSDCCGALQGLLHGSALPAIEELRGTFRAGGVDRLAMLLDPRDTPPRYQAVIAATVNARLQAERAALDIREYDPETPTVFLVLPCVTFNRPGLDTELVIGQYGIDWTGETVERKYSGLGDNPSHYQIDVQGDRIHITDENWPG